MTKRVRLRAEIDGVPHGDDFRIEDGFNPNITKGRWVRLLETVAGEIDEGTLTMEVIDD